MDVPLQILVDRVDKLAMGIVVQFADGRCAFYSYALLYSLLAQAEEMDESVILW